MSYSREIILKDKGVLVIRVLDRARGGPCVVGAEVARRIIRGPGVGRIVVLFFALPRSLCTMRGAENPGVGERVEPTVGVVVEVEGRSHWFRHE